MFRNSLSAEGAKAVTIKAWAPKARMLMPYSGRFVRLCVRLTILNLLKVYMNLFLRFFRFKLFKVLKQIKYLLIKWIMERCYPHLWWYFCIIIIAQEAGGTTTATTSIWLGCILRPEQELVTNKSPTFMEESEGPVGTVGQKLKCCCCPNKKLLFPHSSLSLVIAMMW